MMSPWEVLWQLTGWMVLLILVFLFSWILWCMFEAVVKHFKAKRKLSIAAFTARATREGAHKYSLPATHTWVTVFSDGARWAREHNL